MKPNGFYEWEDSPFRAPALGINSARIDETVTHYHTNSFCGLFGHKSFGFDQADLDFLRRFANAKFLWLWDILLRNVDGLYSLTELEYAGLNPKRPSIDFSRFPKLRILVNYWGNGDSLLDSSISEYHLWHCKPRGKSFEGVEVPLGVQKLEVNWANPESLAGLPRMNYLRELDIHRCRNFRDLSLLPEIAPKLERLAVQTSKQVEPFAGVVEHPTLRHACINGTIIRLRNG
jgi:hypothetical protein